MTTFQIRKCCEAGRYAGEGGLMVMDAPGDDPFWTGEWIGKTEVQPVRRRDDAVHEASHAAVTIALGGSVELVQIDGQPCSKSGSVPLAPRARLAIYLAGDIGQRWAYRQVYRPHDAELTDYLAGLRALKFGQCDYCRAMLAITGIIGSRAPDEAFLKCYREVEGEVIAAVQRRDIWKAIATLADELMTHGVVSGERAHEIIEQFVQPASLNIGDDDDAC